MTTSLLILLAVAAAAAYGLKPTKKAPAIGEQEVAQIVEIRDDMPTQFWPDWHESAAKFLVDNLGAPVDHEGVVALMGLAKALREADQEAYAATVAAMIAERRRQGRPMFWPTKYNDETVAYFLCNDAQMANAPGECVINVPWPRDPSVVLEIRA